MPAWLERASRGGEPLHSQLFLGLVVDLLSMTGRMSGSMDGTRPQLHGGLAWEELIPGGDGGPGRLASSTINLLSSLNPIRFGSLSGSEPKGRQQTPIGFETYLGSATAQTGYGLKRAALKST